MVLRSDHVIKSDDKGIDKADRTCPAQPDAPVAEAANSS